MTPQDAPLVFAPSPFTGLPGLSQIAAILLFVCVVIYISLRVLNARGLLKPNARLKKKWMRILDRLPLGPNRSLLIVNVGEKVHLLGVTEHSINLLSDLDAEMFLSQTQAMDGAAAGATPLSTYLSLISSRWNKNKKEPPVS